MPPGRKKGAAKADNLPKFNVGDLVLAKVKGFPAWPAKISRPEDWEKEPDLKKVFVHFFGTGEITFVAPADVQLFSVEVRKSLLARLQGKSVKFFAKAVREICDACDALKIQDPSSLSEYGSMTSEIPLEVQQNAQSEEACVVTGKGDDDCLVESRIEPENLHIEGNESVTYHSVSKLDETDSTFTGSNPNCFANGSMSSSISLKPKNEDSSVAQPPSKIPSTEALNNHASVAEDNTSHQSELILTKSAEKPKSAHYTTGSRIRKIKLETDGSEKLDSIIDSQIIQEEVIGDGDSSKAVADSKTKKAKSNKIAPESLSSALKSDSEVLDAMKKGSLLKSKRVPKVEPKVGVPKNHMREDLSGRKRKAQLVSKKADVADNELLCPDSTKLKGEISDEGGKRPQAKKRKIDPSSFTDEEDEHRSDTKMR